MEQIFCTPDSVAEEFKHLRQLTILLIEDGDSDAALIAAYLRQTDTIYRLERAISLESGQQRLKTRRYDAVLLDLNLPDSTGLATFELLHEAVPDLPVIVLTGLDSQELATAAVRLGAQDYVSKTAANSEILDRAVRYAIERARGRAAERKLRKIQEEISAARRIQQFLIPKILPEVEGWDIAGDCRPTTIVGGDFFDVFPVGNDQLGLVMADVSGHGFGPALIMTETRRLVRNLARSHADPGAALTFTNQGLIEDTPEDMFVTLFLAVLDIKTRAMVYAAAGHEGYVLRSLSEVTVLESTGLPLGVCQDAEFSWMKLGELMPGDVLVLLTDGFQEAQAANGTMFGIARTLDVVHQVREQPARQILDILFDVVYAYCQPAIPHDDLTALIVKLNG